MITLLGLVITFNNDVVKYHLKYKIKPESDHTDTDSDSEPVMVQISFGTAVADRIFHFLPRAAFFDNRDRGRHSNTIYCRFRPYEKKARQE